MAEKVRTRKTPNGRHLYTATCGGYGCYGWGDTPAEARSKLAENMTQEDEDRRKLNLHIRMAHEITLLRSELRNIANADWRTFADTEKLGAYEFAQWAQSRARYALQKVGAGETAVQGDMLLPANVEFSGQAAGSSPRSSAGTQG